MENGIYFDLCVNGNMENGVRCYILQSHEAELILRLMETAQNEPISFSYKRYLIFHPMTDVICTMKNWQCLSSVGKKGFNPYQNSKYVEKKIHRD